jgi:hypothetical protein
VADIRDLLEQHGTSTRALADAENEALEELTAAKEAQRANPDDPDAKARKKAAAETVSQIRAAVRADRGGMAVAGDAFITAEEQ